MPTLRYFAETLKNMRLDYYLKRLESFDDVFALAEQLLAECDRLTTEAESNDVIPLEDYESLRDAMCEAAKLAAKLAAKERTYAGCKLKLLTASDEWKEAKRWK